MGEGRIWLWPRAARRQKREAALMAVPEALRLLVAYLMSFITTWNPVLVRFKVMTTSEELARERRLPEQRPRISTVLFL